MAIAKLRRLPAAAPVSSLMSREVGRVAPDTPVAQAVSLLLKKTYRTLPVVDREHRAVGILTAGDLDAAEAVRQLQYGLRLSLHFRLASRGRGAPAASLG